MKKVTPSDIQFKKTKMFLTKNDLELVLPVFEEFKKAHIKTLPHCFVHGDLITTNIMKDKKGVLWIIDFSVSNLFILSSRTIES